MKISIIISIYNSHKVFYRQIKYFTKMNLPDDVEFIFVDDGSNPPLTGEMKNMRILQTNNKLAWTQGLGRNLGALKATGEYFLMTDIDHILSKEAIMDVYSFTGDKMEFPRYFGVLLEDGTLTQDPAVLEEYGLDMNRLKTKRGLYASWHGNTWAMKKSTFELLGGYNKKVCRRGYHTGKDDRTFNHVWKRYAAGRGIQSAAGSKIYIFPIGRYHVNRDTNPKGLFHNLSYEQVQQPMKK